MEFANLIFLAILNHIKNLDLLLNDFLDDLLNHKEHKISEIFLSDDVATFEVIILDFNKEYFKFKWQVEKFNKNGPLKDCWLTTAVSSPVSMGSSI